MNNNSSDRKLLLTGETLLQGSVLLNDMVAETTALNTEK
jgi:hypothetical protein